MRFRSIHGVYVGVRLPTWVRVTLSGKEVPNATEVDRRSFGDRTDAQLLPGLRAPICYAISTFSTRKVAGRLGWRRIGRPRHLPGRIDACWPQVLRAKQRIRRCHYGTAFGTAPGGKDARPFHPDRRRPYALVDVLAKVVEAVPPTNR
ncbi:hypothetical protein CBM2609_U10086 [Cupriavidus taiwanensis]|nr:hypothetical protein CBM2609_U10086 [Cupriavidus taiwanensis]